MATKPLNDAVGSHAWEHILRLMQEVTRHMNSEHSVRKKPLMDTSRTLSVDDAQRLIRACAAAQEAFVIAFLGLNEPHADQPKDAGDELNSAANMERPDSIPPEVWEARERTMREGHVIDTPPQEVWQRLIRNRLLVALKRQNMTQSALAKRLEMADSQLSRILAKPESRQLTTLKAIADALQVDIADIVSAAPLASDTIPDEPAPDTPE